MRIKLELPGPPIYTTEISVTISDINYGGHMGNDRFLTLMQEARLRWLHSLGFKNEKEISPPVGLIVVDSAIQYKAEVFHGEKLSVELSIGEINVRNFDLYYKVIKENQTVAALGKTGILCMDYLEKRVVKIPENLLGHLT